MFVKEFSNNIFRKLISLLSFPFNFNLKQISKNERNLINNISFLAKKIKPLNKNKKKTHKEFGEKILKIIIKKR